MKSNIISQLSLYITTWTLSCTGTNSWQDIIQLLSGAKWEYSAYSDTSSAVTSSLFTLEPWHGSSCPKASTSQSNFYQADCFKATAPGQGIYYMVLCHARYYWATLNPTSIRFWSFFLLQISTRDFPWEKKFQKILRIFHFLSEFWIKIGFWFYLEESLTVLNTDFNMVIPKRKPLIEEKKPA